jgi:hypothetical protein
VSRRFPCAVPGCLVCRPIPAIPRWTGRTPQDESNERLRRRVDKAKRKRPPQYETPRQSYERRKRFEEARLERLIRENDPTLN